SRLSRPQPLALSPFVKFQVWRPFSMSSFSSSSFGAARLLQTCAAFALLLATACGGGHKEANWPPVAKKWFDRAKHSYAEGDMADARLASENALSALPDEPKVRIIAAEFAMAE